MTMGAYAPRSSNFQSTLDSFLGNDTYLTTLGFPASNFAQDVQIKEVSARRRVPSS